MDRVVQRTTSVGWVPKSICIMGLFETIASTSTSEQQQWDPSTAWSPRPHTALGGGGGGHGGMFGDAFPKDEQFFRPHTAPQPPPAEHRGQHDAFLAKLNASPRSARLGSPRGENTAALPSLSHATTAAREAQQLQLLQQQQQQLQQLQPPPQQRAKLSGVSVQARQRKVRVCPPRAVLEYSLTPGPCPHPRPQLIFSLRRCRCRVLLCFLLRAVSGRAARAPAQPGARARLRAAHRAAARVRDAGSKDRRRPSAGGRA